MKPDCDGATQSLSLSLAACARSNQTNRDLEPRSQSLARWWICRTSWALCEAEVDGTRASLAIKPAAEGDGCYSSFALLLSADNKEWHRKWSCESKLTVKKKLQTGAHFVIAAWTKIHQTSSPLAAEINSLACSAGCRWGEQETSVLQEKNEGVSRKRKEVAAIMFAVFLFEPVFELKRDWKIRSRCALRCERGG